MKYSRYVVIIILMIIVIPSVAMASWWNPFSWKIFHRNSEIKVESNISTVPQTDQAKEIENLKKEVEDLKNRTTGTPTSPKTTENTKIKNQVVSTLENFNQKSIIAAKGALTELESFEGQIDQALKDVNDRVVALTKVLDYQKILNSKPKSDLLSDNYYNLQEGLERDLNTYVSSSKIYPTQPLQRTKDYFLTNYPFLKNIINTYPQKYISKEQSIKDIESINAMLGVLETTRVSTNKIIEDDNVSSTKFIKIVYEAIQGSQTYLNKIVNQEPVYNYNIPQPTYIQPIILPPPPPMTRCLIRNIGVDSSYGRTIDCF